MAALSGRALGAALREVTRKHAEAHAGHAADVASGVQAMRDSVNGKGGGGEDDGDGGDNGG